jgi:hypothetical protein
MIYEERTYTLRPATVSQFIDAYEADGMAAHRRHLGDQIGFFVTDVGTLNQIVQIWSFADMSDRDRRRKALYEDPEWQAFTPVLTRFIVEMENRILVATRLSQLK